MVVALISWRLVWRNRLVSPSDWWQTDFSKSNTDINIYNSVDNSKALLIIVGYVYTPVTGSSSCQKNILITFYCKAKLKMTLLCLFYDSPLSVNTSYYQPARSVPKRPGRYFPCIRSRASFKWLIRDLLHVVVFEKELWKSKI